VLVNRDEIRPERLAGATVVVIDVFMATTTLLTILENGARSVRPVATLAEAEAESERLDPGMRLRGGEQGAQFVQGFDLGPFPDEYSPDKVSGRDVVFLSTNGTVAIAAVAGAARVLLGSLRNAPALARFLQDEAPDSIYIVCAGSMGRLALEDLAGAAAVLGRMDLSPWTLNDGAWLARDLGERYPNRMADLVRRGRAGRWFQRNGREDAFNYVVDVGASELLGEVREGKLERIPGRVLPGRPG